MFDELKCSYEDEECKNCMNRIDDDDWDYFIGIESSNEYQLEEAYIRDNYDDFRDIGSCDYGDWV